MRPRRADSRATQRIAVNRRRFLGSLWNCRAPEVELLGRITRFVDAGQLRVVIDHIYPLEQAALALEQVEHGHVRRKVVLSIV
ncbi:MAG: zinc-binding dehydrogenase [Chloroflexi bacterium]|nr:MAG: zinc-binding dehydrogenase [Chloroflexota bacterium]